MRTTHSKPTGRDFLVRKRSAILVASLLAVLLGAATALAGSKTTTATGGDWNSTSTWTDGKTPGPNDDINIVAGATLSVTSMESAHSLTFNNNGSSPATFTVASGFTVTVSGALTAQNAASINTTALIQGGGSLTCMSLTVGGTTTPTTTSSDFLATLTSSISNLTISGNLNVKALYNSTQSAANQGIFSLSSGIVSVNGSVAFTTVPLFGPTLTLATGAQNGTLVLSGPNPFTFAGGGSSTFTPNGTNATVNYSGGPQTVQPAVYQNLTLSGSGTKTDTGITVNGTLSRQGTSSVSAVPVYGPTATLEYKGSAAQTSGPELTLSLPNLTVNNTNDVSMTNSSTISGALTLSQGRLITGTNQVNLDTNGTVSAASAASYISGNLQKAFTAGAQAFAFPIGSSGAYAPLTISNLTVTNSGSLLAFTTSGNHPQAASSGINTNRNVNRYWTLSPSGGTFGTYDATFSYPATNIDAGAIAWEFSVECWNGSVWSVATESGTPTTNSTSITGQAGFGDFIIGDTVAPTRLAVISVNGGAAPSVGAPFYVVVQSQNSASFPCTVASDTTVALSLFAGSGALSGTVTGVISNGTSSVTINGVVYNKAESGVRIRATRTSGDILTAGNSSSFTVGRGNQTISFPSPGNQTYGVAPITLSATASSGLTVTFSVTSGPATVTNTVLSVNGAGSVTIQASQSGNANWNAATPVTQTIAIGPLPISGSVAFSDKVYDAIVAASIAGRSLTGVINSDVVALAGGTAAFADKNVGSGKTAVASGLSLTGANAGNYTLTSASATNTANITPAPLTVTANDTNRLYGAPDPSFSVHYTGFMGGETAVVLSGSPSLGTTTTTNSTVPGSPYVITVTQGTLAATNYNFSFVNGNLTITPAPLTVTADDASRLFGTGNPVFTASYSGFVNGETNDVIVGAPVLSTSANTNSPVGSYPITVAVGTLSATNYSFNPIAGTLTILEVPPVLTINKTSGAPPQVYIHSVGATPGNAYQILASTNLSDWNEIASVNAASDGSISFTNSVVLPVQFYRVYKP